MPSAKGLKTSVKMTSGVAEAMKARQGKYGLSELGVNWIGRGGLNASESDLIYKYHVVSIRATPPKRERSGRKNNIIEFIDYLCRYDNTRIDDLCFRWFAGLPFVFGGRMRSTVGSELELLIYRMKRGKLYLKQRVSTRNKLRHRSL